MKPLTPPRLQLSGLVEVGVWLVLLGFLLGYLGKVWWIFDLCAHFRAQYAGALVIGVAVLALSKQRRKALLFLIPTVGIVLTLVPLPCQWPQPVSRERSKIVSFNVNTSNDRYQDVLHYLVKEDADIVFLMEVDDNWLRGLRGLDEKYPFQLKSPSPDNFGIAAYSKQPLPGNSLVEFGDDKLPVLDARVAILGVSSRLIGIHTLPPSDEEQSAARNRQLLHFADEANRSNIPTFMVGDFNLTPFSPWFSEMLTRSSLRNSGDGFGFSPTWLRAVPCFTIPLDQVLVPSRFTVVERKIGPSLGSDHSALVVTLGLAERR